MMFLKNFFQNDFHNILKAYKFALLVKKLELYKLNKVLFLAGAL